MKPRYQEIADDLREQFHGKPPGTKLPSETELMVLNGSALGTVRAALQVLQSEGWVRAEQGRGVFVTLRPGDCGGCQGHGAHKRWCPAVVGPTAAMLGRYAEQAESLGDRVGPNEMGASNHLWQAASLLRKAATEAKIQHMEQVTEETRRLADLDLDR